MYLSLRTEPEPFELAGRFNAPPSERSANRSVRLELVVFAIVLSFLNAPLFGGAWPRHLVFFPELVAAGEWWRVVTHPFVHVSWYHLLLDGSAFLLLYSELRDWSRARRLIAVGVCALGSLLAAMLSPAVASIGFCGLSGVAHGLMAITAVEMIRRAERRERIAGWCALLLVVGKATTEAASGQVALSFLHFGLMGVPIAACHAGGVIAGLILALFKRAPSTAPNHVASSIPKSGGWPT
jgi:rhomboid family GlyGly-CTERM serine protease